MTTKEKEQHEIYKGDYNFESIINSKKIRYELLNQLFDKIPKGKDTVTMYIDLYSILNQLYNPNVLESITHLDYEAKIILTSHIINMAAHYRRYFATRKGMYTNIIFYYSHTESHNEKEVYPDYRKEYYAKRFGLNSDFIQLNKVLKEVFNLCEMISDYLPHVYFVNTKQVNPILAPYYFQKYALDCELPVVYSNDKVQMLNCIYSNDELFMSASYSNVTLYTINELMEVYTKKEDYNDLNPTLLPYIMSLAGEKKYNIEGMPKFGPVSSAKKFKKWIQDGNISNINYKISSMFLDDIERIEEMNSKMFTTIAQNIELFHLPTMFNKLRESDIVECFRVKDLVSINSLIELDNEYFSKYPLMLEELLLGEEYESVH
jgi:hypothetical protein